MYAFDEPQLITARRMAETFAQIMPLDKAANKLPGGDANYMLKLDAKFHRVLVFDCFPMPRGFFKYNIVIIDGEDVCIAATAVTLELLDAACEYLL